jgi:hypothetical protein
MFGFFKNTICDPWVITGNGFLYEDKLVGRPEFMATGTGTVCLDLAASDEVMLKVIPL